MTPLRILAPSITALALASCASQKSTSPYDNPAPYGGNPYGYADAGQADNPVYDTPAAYEETGTTAAYDSPFPSTTPYTPDRPSSNGAAIIHTVVAGDTLSGLSSKYRVPIAEIKQANNMTNDIVVLDRKMVIPPAR
jgi:hypothetical protein